VTDTPSKLSNMLPGAIADELGALQADAAEIEARRGELAAELIRRGVTVAEGALFRATVVPEGTQQRLDRKALERDLGAANIAPYLKESKRAAYVQVHGRSAERKAA
jgi:hypothetical protein